MPSRRRFLGTAIASSLIAGSIARAADAKGREGELAVMTYNLRFASEKPPNDWPSRRPVMVELIRKYRPDIIGTQEGVYSQLRSLSADLSGYDSIGLGRDGGSRGEFMQVFYRSDRLEPLEYDHFWLSDTPEVMGSSTWGNTNRRMVTWVRFLDRMTKRQFHFWNTHLDHALQDAREKAADLILQRIAKQADPRLPLLLVGDFNAEARANPVYDRLVNPAALQDTWYLAKERRNEAANSFNGFNPLREEGQRIDWILARGPVSVRAAEVVKFQKDDQWPSDHCPVMAWLEWN